MYYADIDESRHLGVAFFKTGMCTLTMKTALPRLPKHRVQTLNLHNEKCTLVIISTAAAQ